MSPHWIRIAEVDDVPEQGTWRVMVGEVPVCLYKLSSRIFATHDTCTHADMSLADGFVIGENIECPLHQGLFHIPTGKACGMPCVVDLQTFEIKVEGDTVFVNTAADTGDARS